MTASSKDRVRKSRELARIRKEAEEQGGSLIGPAFVLRIPEEPDFFLHWVGSEWELAPLEQEDSEHEIQLTPDGLNEALDLDQDDLIAEHPELFPGRDEKARIQDAFVSRKTKESE